MSVDDASTVTVGNSDVHPGWLEGPPQSEAAPEQTKMDSLPVRIAKAPTDIVFEPGVHFGLYVLHAFGYLFMVAASDVAATGSLISIGVGSAVVFGSAATAATCRIVGKDLSETTLGDFPVLSHVPGVRGAKLKDVPLYTMGLAHGSIGVFNFIAGDYLHASMAWSFAVGDFIMPLRHAREKAGEWIIADIDKIEGPAQDFRRSVVGTFACAKVNPITYFCSGIACSTYLAMNESGFWSTSSLVIPPLVGVALANGRNAFIQASRSLKFAPNNLAPMYVLAGITGTMGAVAIAEHPDYMNSMSEYFTPIAQAIETSRDQVDSVLAGNVYHAGMATVPFLAAAAYVVIQGRYLGGLKQGLKDLVTWDNKDGLPAPANEPT